MKKNITNTIFIIFLLFICLLIIINSDDVINTVLFSFDIWYRSILPTLLPIFIISDLLIHYGFVSFLSEIFKNIIHILFGINKSLSFIFIMSMISGFPSGAKYAKTLYDNKIINEYDVNRILLFTHFSNPLFLIGTLSITFLNCKKLGLLIIISQYLPNIIIGIFLKNKKKISNEKVSLKKALNDMINSQDKKTLGCILSEAITSSINSLILILGTMTFFLIITTLLNKIITIPNYYKTIINGMVEMTQGLKYISLLNISLKIKSIISVMLISFGGLSIHMQVMGILNDIKFSYQKYLLARICHSIMSGILMYILFDFFMN